MKQQGLMGQALAEFLKGGYDEARASDVEQELEVYLSKTTLYVPAYTRNQMDKKFGRPIMAVFTKTDVPNGIVYIIPADNPEAKEARTMQLGDNLSGAKVAFAVPLRKLRLKLPDRKYTFPLTPADVPGRGTVWSISFQDFDHDKRGVDAEVAAVTQQVKQSRRRPSGRSASSGSRARARRRRYKKSGCTFPSGGGAAALSKAVWRDSVIRHADDARSALEGGLELPSVHFPPVPSPFRDEKRTEPFRDVRQKPQSPAIQPQG